MCSIRKKNGKANFSLADFFLRDSEAEQRALQFLHFYCSIVSSASIVLYQYQNKVNFQKRGSGIAFKFSLHCKEGRQCFLLKKQHYQPF